MRLSHAQLVILSITIIIAIGLIGYFSIEGSRIATERELRQAEILREERIKLSEIEQREETERTEERSQFWQKLVPWGGDEEEISQ